METFAFIMITTFLFFVAGGMLWLIPLICLKRKNRKYLETDFLLCSCLPFLVVTFIVLMGGFYFANWPPSEMMRSGLSLKDFFLSIPLAHKLGMSVLGGISLFFVILKFIVQKLSKN